MIINHITIDDSKHIVKLQLQKRFMFYHKVVSVPSCNYKRNPDKVFLILRRL